MRMSRSFIVTPCWGRSDTHRGRVPRSRIPLSGEAVLAEAVGKDGGLFAFTEELRAAGHTVHAADLY